MVSDIDPIQKITLMEDYLNTSKAAITDLEKSLSVYQETQYKMGCLLEYYGSEEWFAAREMDEASNLPKNLSRGVLTEDLVYDLIQEQREVAIKMLETTMTILKQ